MPSLNKPPNRRILLVYDTPAFHDDLRKILAVSDAVSSLDEDEARLFGTTAAGPSTKFEIESAYQGADAAPYLLRMSVRVESMPVASR